MAEFKVTMQLQRQTEDGWIEMGEPKINNKIPKVRAKPETIVIYPGCITGTWRSKAVVVMKEDSASDHFDINESYSEPHHVSCET